jgi:hypothetical protein
MASDRDDRIAQLTLWLEELRVHTEDLHSLARESTERARGNLERARMQINDAVAARHQSRAVRAGRKR